MIKGEFKMRDDYKELDKNKSVLITGGAGFIGFHLSKRLLEQGLTVIGFDNLNDYYDVNLKHDRLNILNDFSLYSFVKGDLTDTVALEELYKKYKPEIIVNLGAQAGVRYSITHPDSYIQSNVFGFYNILELCRRHSVEHLIFASSSSVYGANTKIPYSTEDKTDVPVSLYAATKKSNEVFAHSYSKLYDIPVTGLRFFTVYGPYGRPDMAYFSFSNKIMKDETINVYNNGDMYRDFTYVDDVVKGIEKILNNPPKKIFSGAKYKIYNIGNNKPEKLMYFIETLGETLGKQVKKNYLPMQSGDVLQTYADVTDLFNDFDYKPNTDLKDGLEAFVQWYKEYYKK